MFWTRDGLSFCADGVREEAMVVMGDSGNLRGVVEGAGEIWGSSLVGGVAAGDANAVLLWAGSPFLPKVLVAAQELGEGGGGCQFGGRKADDDGGDAGGRGGEGGV